METTWELRTYDMWGNAKDGFDSMQQACDAKSKALDKAIKKVQHVEAW